MQTPLRPRVLIIGGGFAGLAAKHEILSQTHEAGSGPLVTLIDDKPFFEYTPALARCIPYPSHIHSITVSHKNDTDIEFIRGRVTQVTTSEATVACGGTETLTVPFDYCIWATGVSYGRPFARGTGLGGGVEVRMGEMASFRRAVAEADRVLVIGGGPIGVELTAELVSFAHDTHITLASPHLLPRFPPGAGKYAAKWLSERKVLLLPARVSPAQVLSDGSYEYVYTTETGEQRVRANLTFDCTGARSNGSVRALLSGGVIEATQVTKDGSVCVRDTLQTTAHEHIFVIGDAGRVDNELLLRPHGRGCEKTAYAAEACGVVAGHNVMRLIEQGGRMYKYPDDMFLRGVFPRVVAISLYSPHAILCVGPVVISGWGVGVVKWMIERLCIRGMNESWAALSFRFLENASFFSASILTLLSERMQRGMR